MIGEMLGELTGKIVGQRVVPHHHRGGHPKIGRTMESRGRILGEEVTLLATFWSMERPEGGMFPGGRGILMTRNGEQVMLRGAGISVPSKGAGWSMRGTRYAQTSPAA